MYKITITTKSKNIRSYQVTSELFEYFRQWLNPKAPGYQPDYPTWSNNKNGFPSLGYGGGTPQGLDDVFCCAQGAIIRSNIDTVDWEPLELEIKNASTNACVPRSFEILDEG